MDDIKYPLNPTIIAPIAGKIVIKADGGSINCPRPPDTNIPVKIGVTTRAIQMIRFIFLFIPSLKVLGKDEKSVFIWRSKRQDYIRVKIADQESWT